MADAKTLTGKTLEEVYTLIDKDLGKDAYKPVGGAEYLTEISPAHTYELLTECFGFFAHGWGFDVVWTEYLGHRQYTSGAGNEITEHGARAEVSFWYRLEGDDRTVFPPIPGGSLNMQRNYAEQGAVTNALSKSISFMGVQRHIYKGASDTPKAQSEKDFDGTVGFGKHKGKTIDAIYDEEPTYVKWLADKAKEPAVRKAAQEKIAAMESPERVEMTAEELQNAPEIPF